MTECSAARLARQSGGLEVMGSNPVIPTRWDGKPLAAAYHGPGKIHHSIGRSSVLFIKRCGGLPQEQTVVQSV